MPDENREFLTAEFSLDSGRLFEVAPGNVVAGAGFEPATFGL